jgi:hypothetical protein
MAHQLKELDLIYRRYREKGLVVIALPSNDFGNEFPFDQQVREVKNRNTNYMNVLLLISILSFALCVCTFLQYLFLSFSVCAYSISQSVHILSTFPNPFMSFPDQHNIQYTVG